MSYALAPSVRTALSTAKVTPAQTVLKEQLSSLDIRLAERFAAAPQFHRFIRQAFETYFAQLTPAPDLLRSYVSCATKPQPLAQPLPPPVEPAKPTEPQTQADAGEQDTAELQTIQPSLMDAIVRRLVSAQAADYGKRQACFYHVPEAGAEPVLYSALTPAAFDGFLDQLAANLPTQYADYLQRYWAQACSPTDPRTYRQWLVATRIEQLQAEVALLKLDGLLEAASVSLFERVLRYPDAQARQALEDYRPCVYALALRDKTAEAMSLHGAFVLTARDPQDGEVRWESAVTAPVVRPVEVTANVGRVLLYTPNNGLEAFDSLASLDRELHRRLGHASEFATLCALVADKDHQRVLALQSSAPERDQLQYLERLESPFAYSIDSQCRLIRENVETTFARYVKQGVHADMANLPAAIDRVTDLCRAFDSQPILEARLRKQCKARLVAFLKDATAGDQEAWALAFKNYSEELANLPEYEGLPSLAQFSERRELLAYSNRQLRAVLEAEHGLTVNPDDLVVHTKEPELPVSSIPSGAPGTSILEPGAFKYKYRQRSLTELALDNISGIDHNFTRYSKLSLKTAVTDQAQRPAATKPAASEALAAYNDLTLAQVKALVRTVNVGQAHQDFLKASLVSSPAAQARKQAFARLIERQLRLDAIEAKINGDFLPDRLQRGFNWVQAVLNAPVDNDQRETVEGHRVIVQCLKLRGQRVRGVLLFATASTGTATIVVYTPGAPAGRVFHEYQKDRLMTDFVHSSSWRDYLLARVDRASQAHVLATLKGRGDVSTVYLGNIANNLFEEAYEVEANWTLNEAAAQVTTTHQTNVETGLLIATTVIDVLSMVLPVHVSLPVGIARSLISIFNAVDAAQVGDRVGAAHHIVRALAEFTGVLIDGVVGVAVARGLVPGAAGAGAGGRQLNPQMALGGKPDGVLELKGWEGKGVYYKPGAGGGGRQYFLKERQHWYSLIDEGFEDAWRLRDARKPLQKHYAPIRRNAQGHWEIGTHPDAPGLGGISPQHALRNLYPYLDELQAIAVFEAFAFPRGREIELGLSFVERLRTGRSTDAFLKYLRVSEQTLRLRLLGQRASSGFSGGGALTESRPGPARQPAPAPEPLPPLPAPAPVPPAPPVRVRPLSEKFLDWGQSMDIAELQLRNAELAIYRRPASGLRPARDYIRMHDSYYPILPAGDMRSPNLTFIFDERIGINHFAQFEHLILTDLFSQPRPAYFAAQQDKLWLISHSLPFEKTVTGYVADSFPTFSRASQQQLAQALFDLANPNGVTASGLAKLHRTLNVWRARTALVDAFGDALTLLPIAPRSATGQWLLEGYSGAFNRLLFSTDGVNALVHAVMRSGTEETLRALMSERLLSSGYEMVSGYGLGSELLFRRPGRTQLFWLSLRRVIGEVIDGSQYVAPRAELMNATTRALVTRAQANNQFVPLLGGVRVASAGAAVEIFVIRV
jgi:hypothetical protein